MVLDTSDDSIAVGDTLLLQYQVRFAKNFPGTEKLSGCRWCLTPATTASPLATHPAAAVPGEGLQCEHKPESWWTREWARNKPRDAQHCNDAIRTSPTGCESPTGPGSGSDDDGLRVGAQQAERGEALPWCHQNLTYPLSNPLQGQDLAVMTVNSKWAPNKPREAKHCYGTTSIEHPAVQMISMERGKYYIGECCHLAGVQHTPMRFSITRVGWLLL